MFDMFAILRKSKLKTRALADAIYCHFEKLLLHISGKLSGTIG